MGLAIVSKIVVMHAGRIEVESVVDKGSIFTVFLPLTDQSVGAVVAEELSYPVVDG